MNTVPQTVKPSAVTVDFSVHDEGSIVIFIPVSEAAAMFADESFHHAMQWGSGFVVEHRFAQAIIHDLITAHHFVCTLDGRLVRVN